MGTLPMDDRRLKFLLGLPDNEADIPPDDAAKIYAWEALRHPILTRDEEQHLGYIKALGEAAARHLPMTPHAHAALCEVSAAGKRAADTIAAHNQKLVVKLAWKYVGYGVPLADLIQEGNLGLLRAVTKWDYRRNLKFSTYATWWIRQACQRALADLSRPIRLPVYVHEQLAYIKRTVATFEATVGREPTDTELAEALDLTVEFVVKLRTYGHPPLDLDQPLGEAEDRTLADVVADPGPGPSITQHQTDLRKALLAALDTLEPREANVLSLRYGLRDGRAHTLEEVGDKYDLTRERVRQIEKEALRRLRHPSRSRPLATYLHADRE